MINVGKYIYFVEIFVSFDGELMIDYYVLFENFEKVKC